MTSYKETHTKSKCDVFSLREVKRDITQHRDGTIKTLETETIKEQAFIQQEQIEREFVIAKELYLNRKMDKWHQLLRSWQKPSTHKRKIMYDRGQSIGIMDAANDLPLLLNDSFVATLRAEHEALAYSCWEIPEDLQLFENQTAQKKLVRRIESHRKRYSRGMRDSEGYGSRYFTMALQKLRKSRSLKRQMKGMLHDLAEDERTRARENPIHVKHIAPGVIRRISAPLFQFSDKDIQVANQHEIEQRHIKTDYYEDYLYRALDSNGQDPELAIPALSQLLTAQILNQKAVSGNLAWPELLSVSEITDKSLHSRPYTPCLFWGKSTTENETFACCQFRIGDVTYDNVWMELPVMCYSTAYGEFMERVGYDMTLARENKQLTCIRDVKDLIRLDPDCSEFSGLRKMQYNMNEMIDQQESLSVLSQKKRDLSSTLRKLKMKSRRI